MNACKTLQNVQRITQCMIESEHSQTQCVSEHSTAERASGNTHLYTSLDYHVVVRLVRRGASYNVNVMTASDFKNVKSAVSSFICNRTRSDYRSTVKLDEHRSSKVAEESTRTGWVWVRLRWTDKDCIWMQRWLAVFPEHCQIFFAPLHIQQLPILKEKYDDLQSLCNTLAIPRKHRGFYHSLFRCSKMCKDRLRESDIDEDSDDDKNSDRTLFNRFWITGWQL